MTEHIICLNTLDIYGILQTKLQKDKFWFEFQKIIYKGQF